MAHRDFTKEDIVRTTEEVRSITEKYMVIHGLITDGWTFCIGKSKTISGSCNHSKKIIKLSREYSTKVPSMDLINTILHEIAHALAGTKHNHDTTWRSIALRIGCDGQVCHNIKFTKPKYVQTCTSKCWTRDMHRKPAGMERKVCTKCKGKLVLYHANK